MHLQSRSYLSCVLLPIAFLFLHPASTNCVAQPPDILPAYFSRLGGPEQFQQGSFFWPPEPSFPGSTFFVSFSDAFDGPNELSKKQLSELNALSAKWNDVCFSTAKKDFGDDLYQKVVTSPKDLTQQQREAVVVLAKKIIEDHEAELATIVSPAQLHRARQIHLQSLEAQAFLLEEIANMLSITKEQSNTIRSVVEANPLPPPPGNTSVFGGGKPNPAVRAGNAAKWKAYGNSVKRVATVRYDKAMKVLTPEQQDQYRELIGQFTWSLAAPWR